ncbi:hypothetical protein ACEZCY_03595 [Streptacidiphilus sp. N1-12]|uniref:Low molecular weight antigen MTB12-like C-terminal domain-containing protein n=2 Tax=Streptacidiphilus alkalitolerans TaxID=3342712 RepID=A0ABV6WVH5_9ACTN
MSNGSANVSGYLPRAAVGAAVLLLATACGSSGGGGTAAPSASPSAAAPTTSAAAPATTSAAAAPAACGTGAAPTVSGTGPSDTAGAAAAISTSYQKFFDPATPATAKVGLLEKGTTFAPVLQSFAANPLAAHATATVLTVSFTGATAADVTYNLCVSGAPALPGSAGKSVLVGGVWQVADATLCNLIKLSGGTSPAACA